MAGIGHNSGNTPDEDQINPDLARALEWRVMKSGLSGPSRLIVHVITKVMARDGTRCHPSRKWIAAHTGMSVKSVGRYMDEIKGWPDLKITPGKGRHANAYKPAFSYRDIIAEYCENYQRPDPTTEETTSLVRSTVSPQALQIDISKANGVPTNGSGVNSDPTRNPVKPVVGSNESVVGSNGSVVGSTVTHHYNTINTIKPEEQNQPSAEAGAKSLRSVVWSKGKTILSNGVKADEPKMGGVIGKGVSDTSLEFVFSALLETEKQEPADPKTYFLGIISNKKNGPSKETAFRDKFGRESF